MKKFAIILISLLLVSSFSFSQKKDKSKFLVIEKGIGYYYESILKDVRDVDSKLEKKDVYKRFQMDQSGLKMPNKMTDYKTVSWHNPTISQGNAGTCWCYSTTSFYESEVFRLTGKKVKLSEIYIAYWEYVEKARRFVQERGDSHFSQGSEANAVTRMFKKYGAVPYSEYMGLINGRKFHTHEKMVKEMNAYLNSLKETNAWNEAIVLETIKNIMNHHIGMPPTKFFVDGKKITPKQYLQEYLKINPNDYVEILSYKQEPYWEQVEYKVPDNWWHSQEYYNVPLDIYMDALKNAILNGYTMSIGGDVSEAGFLRSTNCALIPTFDIPSEFIDEDARQFRFSNKTTTDDHGMHLVGHTTKNGKDWYLIKDSSSGSRNNDENALEFGFYFFQEDYIKLKMMGFTVHKDAVKDVLKKFKK
ncbi:MAG: peptidase C1 [Bacteroidetes bacterium]|jgi:bleomycin hydrolase|nr:peptidase C1 [Bacteroidota bacterium]MBT6685537.1 peptidase C1 [Bacteroidota bacterium]MBT7143653.1 peptidase C1 [Bacteroidota bacterium]MBT7491600.1 peptidase C1 [Bacteroidota bacterium]